MVDENYKREFSTLKEKEDYPPSAPIYREPIQEGGSYKVLKRAQKRSLRSSMDDARRCSIG